MTLGWPKSTRRFLAPEVVQTSAMDCGPASLKALLEGFGTHVSYGRLREACQTDVDGTSIDALEDIAINLGLLAEQIMIPADHLFIDKAKALPAIVVIRLADSSTHFVVVWNYVKGLVQIMDPAVGRRWMSAEQFLNDVYMHNYQVEAADWRDWAGTDEFLEPLRYRLGKIGVDAAAADRLLQDVLRDPQWRPLAIIDAATRMTQSIFKSAGMQPQQQGAAFFHRIVKKAQANRQNESNVIPKHYWSVQPVDAENDDELILRGAVLVRALAKKEPAIRIETSDEPDVSEALSPELKAALAEPPARPLHELFKILRQDKWIVPAVLFFSLLLSAGFILFEALIYRGIIDGWEFLKLGSQRLGGVTAVVIFAMALLVLELSRASGVFRLGRRLEIRLRTAFLEKLPKLQDRYFSSRPVSDMAHRCHLLQSLRRLPDLGAQFSVALFEIIFTMLGIIWIAPNSWGLAVAAAMISILLPLAAMPFLNERDMRLQTHNGALGKFYLDALLGLTPIRTHGAEKSVQREHESLTVEWGRAGLGFHRLMVIVEGLQMLTGFGFAAFILMRYISLNQATSWALLLVYWTLNLPVLGQYLVTILQQIPAQRNTVSRLLEPLGALEEKQSPAFSEATLTPACIRFQSVHVSASGHSILHNINLDIQPGEHVAVLGPSGAGKSTLLGLLLGLHRPVSGRLLVNDKPINENITRLNQNTVWMDPTVHLWNRSMYANILYGHANDQPTALDAILEQANLMPVLQKLPDGMQTLLGESGGLLSGGEGQRVRLARALNHRTPALVLLDEPCRGLEQSQRRQLLQRMRSTWSKTTLICVTHDVQEALSFDRIVVIQDGRIVDNDAPSVLLARQNSALQKMIDLESKIRSTVWADSEWRQLSIENGQVREIKNHTPDNGRLKEIAIAKSV